MGWTVGGFLILCGLFLVIAPVAVSRQIGFAQTVGILMGSFLIFVGMALAGLDRVVAGLWRRRAIRQLAVKLTRLLGSPAEPGPDFASIRWRGSRNAGAVAMAWSLEGPTTQASFKIDEGAPGTLRILPNLSRGGRLIGGRTIPTGHARFDAQFLARSEPITLIGDLFSGERRDRVADALLKVPAGEFCRVILTLGDLRIRIPRMLVRREDLESLLSAAEIFVGALREAARQGGYSILSVGVGTGGRCPVCQSALESEVVLCISCRTPHHQGCWDYTRECAMFACGARRWVPIPPAEAPQRSPSL